MKTGAAGSVHAEYFRSLIDSNRIMAKLDSQSDPRVFAFGRFLRKSEMDELPGLLITVPAQGLKQGHQRMISQLQALSDAV